MAPLARVVPGDGMEDQHRASKVLPKRMSSQRLVNARIIVDLGPRAAFPLAWIALFAAHSACILFLLGTLATLRLLQNPNMGYFAGLLWSDFQQSVVHATECSAMVIIVGIQLALMVLATVRDGYFQLTSLTTECLDFFRWQGSPQFTFLPHVCLSWRVVFGRRGFFGVENPYYEWRYAMGEYFEIAALSLQAYGSSSRLDPDRWLVSMYVASAVLKCWSTPLAVRALGRWYSLPTRRLACVILDALFNSGTAMLFPLVILVPYARVFDTHEYGFETALMYDDAWWTNYINETRLVFSLSILDLLVKLVPHVCVFTALKNTRSLIRRQQLIRQEICVSPSPAFTKSRQRSPRNNAPTTNTLNLSDRQEAKRGKFVDRFFFVWALALLACHISSSAISVSTHDPQCKQPLRPWFVREQACSLYMFNCYHRATDSVQDGDLAFLHRPSLAVLVFAHCPALRMTSSIRSFPKLLGVEVYNSTLVEWGAHAAISAETHPVLSYIFIVRTNMSEIPLGIRGSDLPSTLMDIEFSVTNLTSVPDDLDVVWSQVGSLYIENSWLSRVPDVLQRMPLYEISLIGNKIVDVSSILSMRHGCYMVSIAMNPIQTIPREWEAIDETTSVLNLVETDIVTVPDWFRDVVERLSMSVTLYGTPFCNSLPTEESLELYGPNALISCSLTSERLHGRYPLEITTPLWRP